MCKVQAVRLNYHNRIKDLNNSSHNAEAIRTKINTKHVVLTKRLEQSKCQCKEANKETLKK